MKKVIYFLIILFLNSSCSQVTSKVEPGSNFAKKTNWELIKQIEHERWNKEKLINYFGNPIQTLTDHKAKLNYLIYDDKDLKLQNWSFGIKASDELITITFIPNINNEKNFTITEIIKNWGNDCNKKTETDLSQHFIKKIYYLDCGLNRRAYLNKRNEVTSLSIEFEKKP